MVGYGYEVEDIVITDTLQNRIAYRKIEIEPTTQSIENPKTGNKLWILLCICFLSIIFLYVKKYL